MNGYLRIWSKHDERWPDEETVRARHVRLFIRGGAVRVILRPSGRRGAEMEEAQGDEEERRTGRWRGPSLGRPHTPRARQRSPCCTRNPSPSPRSSSESEMKSSAPHCCARRARRAFFSAISDSVRIAVCAGAGAGVVSTNVAPSSSEGSRDISTSSSMGRDLMFSGVFGVEFCSSERYSLL